MRDRYKAECEAIVQNCTYSAEAHHIIADKRKRLGNWFQILPAGIAAVLGVLAGVNVLAQVTPWLAAIAAAISAVSNVLNPFAEHYAHLNAAKSFTVLKQDARAMMETFSASMDDANFAAAVQALHARYSEVVRLVPATDKKSFEAARRNINDGRHTLDAPPSTSLPGGGSQ
jgi:hypothetical protein